MRLHVLAIVHSVDYQYASAVVARRGKRFSIPYRLLSSCTMYNHHRIKDRTRGKQPPSMLGRWTAAGDGVRSFTSQEYFISPSHSFCALPSTNLLEQYLVDSCRLKNRSSFLHYKKLSRPFRRYSRRYCRLCRRSLLSYSASFRSHSSSRGSCCSHKQHK